MNLRDIQRIVHVNAIDHGWWDRCPMESGRFILTPDELLSKLMLITTEVAEAAEDVRVGAMTTLTSESGKPIGFPSELADVVIRCLDLAGALGIDLEAEIRAKHSHNETRPVRHGGKLA